MPNPAIAHEQTNNPELLQLAYSSLQQGALDKAEHAFQGALSELATHAEALNGLGFVAVQRGRFEDAIDFFGKAVETAPNYTSARENAVNALMVEGKRLTEDDKLEDAMARLRAARALLSGREGEAVESGYRTALGYRFAELGIAYRLRHGKAHRAVDVLREGRGLAWDNTQLRICLDDALRNSNLPAKLSDFTDQVACTELGTHLLIACFPKSGSTFLKNLLIEITGFEEQNLAYSHAKNHTGIYLPDLIYSATMNTVTQLHVRATDSNLNLIQGFQIKPIILVRNIYDVLLSYKEHHDLAFKEMSFYDSYDTLDEDQRLDLIIDDRAAWYIAFFAGWQRAVRDGRIEGYWLTYDELMPDKAVKVEEIMEFCGLDRTNQVIVEAIDKVSANKSANRFNKGVSGRGGSRFTDTHRERITRIASYHPDIDFSMIGL